MRTIKNMLTAVLILHLLVWSTVSNAQSDLQDMEYGAYLSASKTLWKSVVEKHEAKYENSGEIADLYALVAAQHGLLNLTMSDQDEDLFDQYIDNTKENLETLIDKKYNEANSKALLSAVYGLEMGYSSWKGIFLGPKSGSLIEEALAMDNTSPIVWQVQAGSKLFTPAMFGGDQQEAVKAYEKAVSLYEQKKLTKSNWRYLDALAWLGQAYAKTEQPERAKETFEKALKIEPDFNWVKHALLPKLASK